MRTLMLLGSAMLLVSVPATAVVIPFAASGQAGGFRQDFRLDFAGTVVSASATLSGTRLDVFYDSSHDEFTTNVTEFEDSCTAPGVCTAFSRATIGIGPSSVRFRITTRRGFDNCQFVDSFFDGQCARFFGPPEILVSTVVTGPGTYELTLSPPVAIPEPGQWLSLLAGFGLVGAGCRRTRAAAARRNKVARLVSDCRPAA